MFLAAFAQDPIANTIAVIVLVWMIVCVVTVIYHFIKGKADHRIYQWPRFSIPILSIIGLGVAVYLAFVEVTKTEAVCGPIGDCGTVQESPFAYLFGVIPIGLIGVVGYIAILITWFGSQYGPSSIHKTAVLGLWTMGWFGIAFSIYLTFLEPFIIGATCAWCVSSAIIMSLIFLISSKAAIEALQIPEEELESGLDEYSEATS